MNVPLTIHDHLERAALVYRDRVGMVDEPEQPAESWGEITYGRMAELARAQAAGLDRLGVAQGERVAIVSQNSARLLTSFFGVSAFGRIIVPINFRLNADEVRYLVEHSGASMLLLDPEVDQRLPDVSAKYRFVLGESADAELYRFGYEPEPWERDEDETASINYTSGTTARPKGVQLTHRNLWVNAATLGWHMGVSDRDVYLHTLPMFHCNGWGMPYAVTAMGGRHIVLRKVDGAEILRRIEAHAVTLLCGAPAVVDAVLSAAGRWDGPVPGRGQVRIVVAGAPPPTRTIERVETELGWEFTQIYGLTETAPLLTANRGRSEWDDLEVGQRARKLARAGAPALGVSVSTTDDDEICARSSVVMKGYWEQPDATEEAIRDGWFLTGDAGFVDADNYVTVADRKKDVIITGGENVSSIEVEDVIRSHPGVAGVAVIGVPDEKWGETVKALVVVYEGEAMPEADLIEYCRERMAHFKCPTSVEFRGELPLTATGKVQKFKLRSPYWHGRERQVN